MNIKINKHSSLKIKRMANQQNNEQRTAKLLQNVNVTIAVLAFLPALGCFLYTLGSLSPQGPTTDGWGSHYSDTDKLLSVSSSILLTVFYGYTILCPKVYLFEQYNTVISRNYWITVIVVNALTLLLFANFGGFRFFFDSSFLSVIAWLPVLPLSIAIHGILLNLNLLKTTYKKIKNERN